MALQSGLSPDNEKAVRAYGPLAYAIVMAELMAYLLASNVKLNQRVAELEQRVTRQARGGMGGGRWRGQRGMMGRPGGMGTPAPGVPMPVAPSP